MGGSHYKVELRDSDGAIVVKGPVHSEHLEELREILIESLSKTSTVVIHVTKFEHLTSAFNQLLCSACRTSRNAGKSVLIQGKNLAPVNELAKAIDSPLTSSYCEDAKQCLQICTGA